MQQVANIVTPCGVNRTHGLDLPEDMTIPIILVGKDNNVDLNGATIKDLPPTISELLGVHADSEWEGKSLILR